MKQYAAAAVASALIATAAPAALARQTVVVAQSAASRAEQERRARVEARASGRAAQTAVITPADTYAFITSESFDGRIVVGAPYAADAVTEVIQPMCDGNRIVRRSTARVFRDTEGRTRRESSIAAIGFLRPSGEPQTVISIHDPVEESSYTLDPEEKTYRKSGMNFVYARGRSQRLAPGAHPIDRSGLPRDVEVQTREESLGRTTIEGVEAEGTRTVTTIPAGAIGNERPIDIVHERWYSPQLHVTVMTRQFDPRSGETIYRLTNVRRGEQPRELFAVPAGFTREARGTSTHGIAPKAPRRTRPGAH